MPDFFKNLLFSCDTQWVGIKYLAGIIREQKLAGFSEKCNARQLLFTLCKVSFLIH
jgi:hypothetical protein